MEGMATCNVCGRDFALMKEEHYVARGVFGLSVSDAFDCPHCGCQYIAQERKAGEISSCEEEYVGDCERCKYDAMLPSDDPCRVCNHNNGKLNKFEPKEGHE